MLPLYFFKGRSSDATCCGDNFYMGIWNGEACLRSFNFVLSTISASLLKLCNKIDVQRFCKSDHYLSSSNFRSPVPFNYIKELVYEKDIQPPTFLVKADGKMGRENSECHFPISSFIYVIDIFLDFYNLSHSSNKSVIKKVSFF